MSLNFSVQLSTLLYGHIMDVMRLPELIVAVHVLRHSMPQQCLCSAPWQPREKNMSTHKYPTTTEHTDGKIFCSPGPLLDNKSEGYWWDPWVCLFFTVLLCHTPCVPWNIQREDGFLLLTLLFCSFKFQWLIFTLEQVRPYYI